MGIDRDRNPTGNNRHRSRDQMNAYERDKYRVTWEVAVMAFIIELLIAVIVIQWLS